MKIPMPDRLFKGYIFDCDGTLADTMLLHFCAWKQVVGEVGGELSESLFYEWGGRPSARIVEDLNMILGLHLDIEQTVQRKEGYYLNRIDEVRPILPVVEIARRMHGQSVLAVASGGYREYVERTLDVIGIRSLFDVIVDAEDYVHGKPNPDPFLEAARLMRVAPGDCLVFEDSPAGIEAAHQAGMECVCVPSTRGVLS